jgi:isovaleryl-CoA dehydrogenase
MTHVCFELDAERLEVLDAADRYARERLQPLATRMDEEEFWPDAEFRMLGREGYFGITVPADLGGAGLDLFASGLVAEAFARWNPALALSWVAHENLCLNNVLRNGNDEQRRRWVPGLCDGSRIGCLALTEPGAGSDALGSMRTTARREGDHYVLAGRKLFITNGPVADVVLVYAKTEPARGSHGISAFLLDTDTPGFSVAQKLEKMGFRGSPTAELVFDDCRIPADCLLGEENAGNRVVMSGLDLERALVAPLAVGIAERSLALSLEHAKTREQFGLPIGSFQMVQSRLAEMYTLLEAMRTMNYRCLAACNDLELGGGGRGPIHKLTAATVMFAADALNEVLDHAVQIHGGMGYVWESEINRLYRTIKLLEIGAGTTEVRKMIIAKELLKEPAR